MNDELKTKEGRLLAYINNKAKSLGITIEELIASTNLDDLAREFKALEEEREIREIITNTNPDIKIVNPEWEEIKRVETAKAKAGK